MTIRGLYAITDEHLRAKELLTKTRQLIKGGTGMIQYRNKHSGQEQHLHCVYELLSLCRQQHVPLIINDDVELAKSCGADGVHLGEQDMPLEQARAILGPRAIIGVSCYNELNRAIIAQSAGADYVAFGSFFPSPTKPDAVYAPVELITQAKTQLSIPVVAIGGITPDNAAGLIAAGADAIAVIHALFGQADPARAARMFVRLFTKPDIGLAQRTQQ
jgi:thiamine-phosphate pyrophosphorylase